MLNTLLELLYRAWLPLFPSAFRAQFAEEMTTVFDERLAEAADHGAWAVATVAVQELGRMPVALLGVHLYRWQKQWQWVGRLLAPVPGSVLFAVPPRDEDGRFSLRQLLLEISPFFLSALVIGLPTYRPPQWLSAEWSDPADAVVLWAGLLPLPVLLLGAVRGLPRWAYPYGGLVAGYTFWSAAELRLTWLWAALLAPAVLLLITAALIHRREQSLPPFFRRLDASVALDWTRLSFGAFGAAPLFILAAFDNGYLNGRTPYLALSLLLMLLTVVGYCRRRQQKKQLATLLVGGTLLFVPALLDHLYWQGGVDSVAWLVGLWSWLVTLLVLPLLAVPVQWTTHNLDTLDKTKE